MSEPQASSATSEDIFDDRERLVLASSSPRRAEILRAVGWPFEVSPANIREERAAGENAVAYVERLAREKAEAAAARYPARLVLGADTTVVVEEDVLEKPLDEEDARRMLRRLSGRWHEVLTGVALVRAGEASRRLVSHARTEVRFAELSDAEINWYVASGEPLGKAGAYAVQGRASLFIEAIRGEYWNVVGLPIQLVYRLAREMKKRD
ncbi:MAG TPA: Maf family protein [Pyrinomonadaceae bacterium]|jgi:septum formation protein|nr:Maf family protein [Pyrinomonadaceae bacterium]